ncbi:MAG: HAMP domain-containing sensor histidine kinase [Acidimicrobiales bacterium]
MVVGCERSLRRALVNLLTNAMQYGNGWAEITLATQPATDRSAVERSEMVTLRITVTDNGDGIAPSDQAECFLPSGAAPPSGIGLGLGLPVAVYLVDALGGSITYTNGDDHSDGPSTFTIDLTLPAADDSRPID